MTPPVLPAATTLRFLCVFALSGLSACAAHHSAGAPECLAKPLAELHLSYARLAPVVDVVIAGNPVRLMVDLGSGASFVTESFAQWHKLPRTAANMQRFEGAGGFSERLAALASSVELGSLKRSDQRFEVFDFNLGGGIRPVEGTLGLDILRDYDIDLDMPHSTMTLTAPTHCDGPPAGWAGPATAVQVEHGDMGARHMMIPVRLNGRTLTALLDSGTSFTIIGTAAAEGAEAIPGVTGRLSLNSAGIGTDAGSSSTRTDVFGFHSITIGNETLKDQRILVGPVSQRVGDAIVGADFLHAHRVWIPADSSTVWFGPVTVSDVASKYTP